VDSTESSRLFTFQPALFSGLLSIDAQRAPFNWLVSS
jgi:hypothetical protein